MLHRDVVTTGHEQEVTNGVSYALSGLEDHPSIANFFKWDVSYSCAPVDTISTDKRVARSLYI